METKTDMETEMDMEMEAETNNTQTCTWNWGALAKYLKGLSREICLAESGIIR